jgi:hypothetical protein
MIIHAIKSEINSLYMHTSVRVEMCRSIVRTDNSRRAEAHYRVSALRTQ